MSTPTLFSPRAAFVNADGTLTAEAYRALKNIMEALGALTTDPALILTTTTDLDNDSGASAATLTNSPIAGNPTKWATINDNGVMRRLPLW